jgi:hypothetical protein
MILKPASGDLTWDFGYSSGFPDALMQTQLNPITDDRALTPSFWLQ